MIQALSEAQLIKDLRSIKLSAVDRNRVLRAEHLRREHGAAPTEEVVWMRRVAELHLSQLKELWKARETAQTSMGREKSGMSDREVEEAVARRKAAARKRYDPGDFGF